MLTIVIQAGGESRRMGQDKALLPFLGQPLIVRVLNRVAYLADEVLVTTNRPEEYRFLGLPLSPDLRPGRGALGGLYTALSVASRPLVAVVACDLPFANGPLLAAELALLESTASDAVIPLSEGGTEPFHALYRRATCLPAIETALQEDKWRVDSWFKDIRLYRMTPEEVRLSDPKGIAFSNVNTQEEFRQAEDLARAEDRPPGLG